MGRFLMMGMMGEMGEMGGMGGMGGMGLMGESPFPSPLGRDREGYELCQKLSSHALSSMIISM